MNTNFQDPWHEGAAWRGELVETRGEARDFLCRYVSAANIPPHRFNEPTPRELRKADEFVVIARTTLLGQGQSIAPSLMNLSVFLHGRNEAQVTNLYLHIDARKKKIGAMSYKAALGAACEWGASVMRFDAVIDNGPSFWSIVAGAVPEEPLDVPVGAQLRREMTVNKKLTKDDLDRFKMIAEIDDRHPLVAWRLLSQALLSEAGKLSRIKVFSLSCVEADLFAVLGDPSTRDIAARHVGVMPPFRPLPKTHKFYAAFSEMTESLPRFATCGL